MRRLRKKQIKKMSVLCLAGCMLVIMGGCGGASYDSAATESVMAPAASNYSMQEMGGGYITESADMKEEPMEEEAVRMEDAETDGVADNAYSERKLIKTVDLNVETKEFDLVMSTLEEQIEALGGYIENMETYNGSSYSHYRSTRNANMTIRIPKDKLDGFLEIVSDISNVVRRSENVDDVTLAYVDIESRRNSLRTEQTRLLELLAQAESIEDIITIEERLSNVRYELESMESQLRTYDNKVDYSTVYLYVDEVEELTPVVEETAWERITGGFADSLWDIGNGLKEFGIWFLVHIPYMVVWATIITVAIVIIKKITIMRRKRKQHKVAQIQQNVSDTGVQSSADMRK